MRCIGFTLLPISLLFGYLPAAIVLSIVFVLIGRTDWLMTKQEKLAIDQATVPKLNRLGLPIQSLWSQAHSAR